MYFFTKGISQLILLTAIFLELHLTFYQSLSMYFINLFIDIAIVIYQFLQKSFHCLHLLIQSQIHMLLHIEKEGGHLSSFLTLFATDCGRLLFSEYVYK